MDLIYIALWPDWQSAFIFLNAKNYFLHDKLIGITTSITTGKSLYIT